MQRWDVFVSYAHEDEAWVQALAENMHRVGLEVFLDQWEAVGGSRLSQRLQQGLGAANVVVLVVSAAAVGKSWWQEEFAAAMAGVVAGVQRLVPVLLNDVQLPPFVAGRVYVDFRQVDSPAVYEAHFVELVRTVRGLPAKDRPGRGGGVVAPPGVYRAEGPRVARLRIDPQRVVFSCAEQEVTHTPRGGDGRLSALVWEVQRARSGSAAVWRLPGSTAVAGGVLHSRLIELGRALGARFLNGPAGVALAQEVARAGVLQLAVQVDDPGLADLPWETLVVPGHPEPLVLRDGVQMHRAVQVSAPAAVQVPGPLRVLVVIASPERGGRDLLDYEAELARILDAVDPTRRGQDAYVRVLNWGAPGAIREALATERFHVLHISCHAQPGALVLETDSGEAELVSAQRFVREVLVPDQAVPLVVLAGCSTALADRKSPSAPPDEGEPALAGLARDLLHVGVPAVLAMTAPVTDRYATALCAELYAELARQPEPSALAELSTVRRRLEDQRRARPAADLDAAWAQWPTPALFLAGPALPLYRRADGGQPVPDRPRPAPAVGDMIRRVEDFVGRRAQLRMLRRALRTGQRGVVVHGIGGIGKSSLAAQLVDQLGEHAGLVVPIVGHTRVDLVLEEIRQRLLSRSVRAGHGEMHPHRQLSTMLANAGPPWEQRLALIRDVVLADVPILLLLDNAEDNLTTAAGDQAEFSDPQLAQFLASWVALDRTRLLVTSRHPFTLPNRAHRRLAHHHLGPLSVAETRKMIWRLPALDALTADQRHRAYTDLGGHPRSLEYLDALLRGDQARFDDVADRLEAALAQRGISHPERWPGELAGDLDRALAETITLTVDDVLLDDLLDRLSVVPLAPQLLLAAAVYRQPVDRVGLAWQVSQIRSVPEDPDRDQRMRATSALITEAQRSGRPAAELGLTQEMLQQYQRDWEQVRCPPLVIPPELDDALAALLALGLIASLSCPDPDGATEQYLVHRSTVVALRRRADDEHQVDAHRRAAQFWQWRVDVWPQDRITAIQHLIEARFHHYHAGNIDQATSVTEQICLQLHTWGAWSWQEDLCTETLTWLSPRSRASAVFTYQLGMIAQQRGDYAQAEQRSQASLTLDEELGDRAGISYSCHQLGRIAELMGDYIQAEQRSQASLTIAEELGDWAGVSTSYHQLGMIAQWRGDYVQAEQRYQASLTIKEELGDRVGVSASYHQLGMIAQWRGDYVQAEQRYQAALTIFEEVGYRAGIAATTSQLGVLRMEQGRPAEGVRYNVRALVLRLEIESSEASTDIFWLAKQRQEIGEEVFTQLLGELLDASSVQVIMGAVQNVWQDA